MMFIAQATASRAFEQIGVELKWGSVKNADVSKDDPLVITILDEAPANLAAGALADALPFERVHIRIFYGRVAGLIPLRNQAPVVLGHVMTHEIAHMLQEVDYHAKTGIQKARWSDDDFSAMLRGGLGFEEFDKILIRRGIEQRRIRRSRPAILALK
jgi:hypothetical protein